MSTSPTPCSSSVCVTLALLDRGGREQALCAHSLGLDDPRHGHDLVPAHDERPGLTLRAGDFRVHEHVLDLLRAPGETVAGSPPAYLKAPLGRGDAPRAPADLALEHDRRLLEPHVVVLAD